MRVVETGYVKETTFGDLNPGVVFRMVVWNDAGDAHWRETFMKCVPNESCNVDAVNLTTNQIVHIDDDEVVHSTHYKATLTLGN